MPSRLRAPTTSSSIDEASASSCDRTASTVGSRPHHVDGFDVDLRALSPQEVLRRVERDEADWGYTLSGIYFDPALGLVEKYGLNRSQLFVRPGLTMRMLGFNSSRPLFRNNPDLRRAVNFALNRRALVNVGGSLVSRPSDQYLPAIIPGFKDADVYPLERADLQRARALASGNLRGGKAILYVNSSPLPMAIGQLIKQQLAEIGLDVELRGIPIHSASAAYFNKLATPGEPWDMAFGLWSPSYIDPFAYINLLFDGRFVGGTNFIRFASTPLDKQMRRAARLPQGSSRNSAYAALDVRLAREAAPIAAVDFLNEPTLVSRRVGCIVLRPVLDLTAVCLKRCGPTAPAPSPRRIRPRPRSRSGRCRSRSSPRPRSWPCRSARSCLPPRLPPRLRPRSPRVPRARLPRGSKASHRSRE